MDFNAMFQTWMNVLTKPSEATFEAERHKPNANLTTALIWIVVAGVIVAIFSAIGAVISGFIGGGSTLLESALGQSDLPPEVAAQLAALQAGGGLGGGVAASFCAILLVPIFFLIGSAIYFGVAKILGGTGNFEEHTYMLATFSAPTLILSSVVGIIPFLGGCVSFLITIYQIVLTYFAVKVTHNLSSGSAIVVALTPVIIFFLCFVCIFLAIFAGAFGAVLGG